MNDAIYDVRVQSNDPLGRGTVRVLAKDADDARTKAHIQPVETVLEIVEVARV